jgi:regulator of sigma D
MASLIPWKKCFLYFGKSSPSIIGIFSITGSAPKETLFANINSYIPTHLLSWIDSKKEDINFQYIGIFLIMLTVILFLWNPIERVIVRWNKKRKELIPLKTVIDEVYIKTKGADLIRWHLVGITREDFSAQQLLMYIKSGEAPIYGYITLKGNKTSAQKIEKILLNEIPKNTDGKNKWNEDYSIIIGPDGNSKYIETGMRKKDVQKLIHKIKMDLERIQKGDPSTTHVLSSQSLHFNPTVNGNDATT